MMAAVAIPVMTPPEPGDVRPMSMTQPGASAGAAARTALDAARDELRAEIGRGAGGRAALERHADRVDELLRQLYSDAGVPERPVAVIALGGYGRRHLSLHSDIDLLVLFGGRIGPSEERFLRGFLHPLWDLGVVVGHQVRELDEFADLETDNPEFLLALLDARLVAGAAQLFERLGSMFHRPATHAYIVRSLLQLIEERHTKFNATLYQLEPDVKEAPGALRDVMAARTIAALTDPLLLRRGPADPGRFEDAEDFLLRVRSILHLEAGRNQNVLSHELQEKTAEVLGYPGAQPQQRVERLDERLLPSCAHRQPIARVGAADGAGAGRAEPRAVARRHPLPRPGAGGAQSRVVDRRVPGGDRRGHRGDRRSALVHPAARRRLSSRGLHRPRHATRRRCCGCSSRRPGLYARLSQMHDCGLLGRLFPEFQAISWRVVRDFYHKYTVDEHTLLTIRNFERFASTDEPTRQRFKTVAAGIPSPELLVLSLLLHDVGKWRDDEHALESERMAVDALDRLQVTGEARETVQFLIRNHLRMSLSAFRRDTEDPEIVKEFARLVGTEDRLKMLCLLTLADIEAVSPETLTPWKEELIWRLYVDTYNQLTQGYGDELIERNQAGLDRAAGGSSDRTCPRRRSPGSSKGCRSATCSSSRAMPSTGTCGSRATSGPTRSTCRSTSPTRCGRSRWSRSTSRSCSRTSAACCRRSA